MEFYLSMPDDNVYLDLEKVEFKDHIETNSTKLIKHSRKTFSILPDCK